MDDGNGRTFRCTDCGQCCTAIKETAGEEIRSVLDRSQGLNGFYFLPDTRHVAPYLFEWELEPIQRLAKEKGVRFRTAPRHVFLDARLLRVLVMEWTMDFTKCPFHAGEKCSIYENRPMICRQYPVLDVRRLSEKCSGLITPPEDFAGKELDAWMEKTYSRPYSHALHAHDVIQHNYGIIARLGRSGVLVPAVGWELKTVNRLSRKHSTGLFAFMVERGIIDTEECERQTGLLSTPSGARRLLDEPGV
jgi:Fe-S-cluster containining protein